MDGDAAERLCIELYDRDYRGGGGTTEQTLRRWSQVVDEYRKRQDKP